MYEFKITHLKYITCKNANIYLKYIINLSTVP